MKFKRTSCSSCGGEFGPGDSGFSHCDQHDLGQVCAQLRRAREVIAEKDQYIEWALDMLPDAEYSDDTEEAHEMPTYYLNRALKLKLDAPEDSK